jgi:hypothetical protein
MVTFSKLRNGRPAVANEEHDFAKLLRDAPMAPDAETVTVVGTLARTHDASHFVLTLPDGRSVTLEVNAVKSAKTMAGAIGQSVVQLELDAKRIPENVATRLFGNKSGPDYTMAYIDYQFGPYGSPFDPGHGGAGPKNPAIEIGGVTPPAWFAQPAPFVAAMPHQASPATIEALALFGGTRTYFNAYNWTTDHTHIKPRLDQP